MDLHAGATEFGIHHYRLPHEQGIVKELVSLVKDGLLPLEVAAQRAKVTVEEMKNMCQLV